MDVMETKRRFTRIGCDFKASIQLEDAIIVEANILNISLNGAFFELADYRVFQVGDQWGIRLELADSEICLNFKAEVIHSQNRLVGVKFVHIDIDSMIHLRSMLEIRTSNPSLVEKEIELLYDSGKRN
jgi:hypothetical protein